MKLKSEKPHTVKYSITKYTIAVLMVILIGFGFLLARSYGELNLSIQNERVSSVEQLGVLLSDKVNQLKTVYTKDIEQLANVISGFQISSKEELNHILHDGEHVLLITEDGMFRALDGSNWIIQDNGLIDNVLNDTEAQTSFGSEQTRGDFWLFSIGIEPAVIDGETIIGLVKPVSAQEYAEVATLSLYDGFGRVYVTDNNGVIIMRPQSTSIKDQFNGYNLFSILRNKNVTEENIQSLQSAIKEQANYQLVANMDGTTWLIQSVPGDYGRGIVITVPISITAKATYSGMQQVIVLITVMSLLLAGIAILCILYVLRKNQAEEVMQIKIKAKNDFLDKMSHDIRTPLNAIVGMNELALRSLDDRQVLSDYLHKTKRSSEYLVSIINDILDMSKIENGKMTISQVPFSMKELFEHVYQMEILSAQNKKVSLNLDIEKSVYNDFIGDPVRIRQCLMNLVSNSIKFTPEDGSINIGYNTELLDEMHSQVVITVQDTGIGMSADFMSKIFKPFEQEYSSMTSNYNGSGLGLAIVSNLTELMGGNVTVESKLGEGSIFTIKLPLEHTVRNTEKNNEQSEEDILAGIRGKRILFAEDNELNREIGVSLLEQLGLIVDQAENGKRAFEMFEQSSGGYYSLIFMDIQMPVMNGYEAVKNIRASTHPDSNTVPILALSANAFDEDAKKSLQAGMQGHLAKPIDIKELMTAFQKYICQGDAL